MIDPAFNLEDTNFVSTREEFKGAQEFAACLH